MTLDARAKHAARAIQISVSGAAPVGMTVVRRRHRRSILAGLVGALAIAFASIALASTIPDMVENDTATIDRTTPDVPDAELVVLPEDGDREPDGIRQKHDVSDSPEPYTQFFGMAEPGTVVIATSEFGSADLVVGESGEFHLELIFEDPPKGVHFPIILSIGDEEHEFGFTWLWDPEEVDVSAHQTYRVSDDPEAFEKFFGTAPPGTEIIATSGFGSADAVADEHGEWYLKLFFSELPFDEPFPINVAVGDEIFEFEFVSLFQGEDHDITVAQHGKVSDDPNPYTRFVGTAPPGTHVLATSAYGSADLEVGEHGEFSLKVWFSHPPAGVTFPITLKIDGETWGTFYFTSYWTPEDIDFTLVQHNTSSDSPEPYIKFYGTAPAGTTIVALSEYGAEDLTVGEGGEWQLKLFFSPLPPAGVQFPVTVKVNGETYGTFNFTSWFDPGEVEVTVNQYNTESDSPEPWVKFYGTAPIGTQVQITSGYGSTSWTTEGVEWLGKLHFSTLPPAGVEFPVTVKINGETWSSYPFTSWYEEPEAPPVTVNHAYSSCSLDPPYDDLWGTAPMGTLIQIVSPYGSGSLEVGESGNWEKRVYFEGAPYGEPFTVTVKIDGSAHTSYSFTVYAPE